MVPDWWVLPNVMRVLLDTNVFINREGDQVLSPTLRRLLRSIQGAGSLVLVHPASLEDLEHDKDGTRHRVAISKFDAYPRLESAPDPSQDSDYLAAVGPLHRRNDFVDATLLYAVYRDAVDVLLTDDLGIHRMAARIGVRERVASVEEASVVLSRADRPQRLVRPPALAEDAVHNLRPDDEFFDSLREEYDQFDAWFTKISREGRRCWVYRGPSGAIGALLIYKIEEEPIDCVPPLASRRRLKISTMKVSDYGQKIGELFIKLSVQYSLKNDLEELYLTHFTRPMDHLVALITEFGFDRIAVRRNGEDVFLKHLSCDKEHLSVMNPIEVSTRHWPCLRDSRVTSKFIVPILPKYHVRLFTDFAVRQTSLREHSGEFIVEGNTIRKAYLTRSKVKRIRPGDVVLFYRSQDVRGLTSLGVVESVAPGMTDPTAIMEMIQKRTVYTPEEVRTLAKVPTTVILFNWHFHFPHVVGFDDLKRAHILKGSPQSILQISHNAYMDVRRRSGIDDRFVVT